MHLLSLFEAKRSSSGSSSCRWSAAGSVDCVHADLGPHPRSTGCLCRLGWLWRDWHWGPWFLSLAWRWCALSLRLHRLCSSCSWWKRWPCLGSNCYCHFDCSNYLAVTTWVSFGLLSADSNEYPLSEDFLVEYCWPYEPLCSALAGLGFLEVFDYRLDTVSQWISLSHVLAWCYSWGHCSYSNTFIAVSGKLALPESRAGLRGLLSSGSIRLGFRSRLSCTCFLHRGSSACLPHHTSILWPQLSWCTEWGLIQELCRRLCWAQAYRGFSCLRSRCRHHSVWQSLIGCLCSGAVLDRRWPLGLFPRLRCSFGSGPGMGLAACTSWLRLRNPIDHWWPECYWYTCRGFMLHSSAGPMACSNYWLDHSNYWNQSCHEVLGNYYQVAEISLSRLRAGAYSSRFWSNFIDFTFLFGFECFERVRREMASWASGRLSKRGDSCFSVWPRLVYYH